MSDNHKGASGAGLRDYRIQKKPSFSHNNSNGSLNSSADLPVVVAKPRRRILKLSDSDSDCDQARSSSNVIVKNTSDGTPKKSDKVVERELLVRQMIKAFPNVQSLEIYDILSEVNFNMNEAIEILQKKGHNSSHHIENPIPIKPINTGSTINQPIQQTAPKTKRTKTNKSKTAKRRKGGYNSDDSDGVNYYTNNVYDSDDDDDSDAEVSNTLTGDKKRVMEFLQTATQSELQLMNACSKKKADAILEARPFEGWVDLVQKLQTNKNLNTDLLNAAQRVLVTRNNMKTLMKKCASIAGQLKNAIEKDGAIKRQPSIITPSLKLTSYQMVGLNWLAILHELGLNGILADEMGLGKTVQVIAFLAYLKEIRAAKTTHLVIVPASTLENWQNEFVRWCPQLRVLLYYGSVDERRGYRMMFEKGKHRDFDVILTTYSMAGSTPEERKMFKVTPMHYVIFDEAHMLKNMNTQRYQNLARIKAAKRILLTGTPLQNNLLELMSLLIFVMPNIFSEKSEDLKNLFQKNQKKDTENVSTFEREQIEQAKQIMKPFVLRRLKCDVLQDLPKKTDVKLVIPMSETQEPKYVQLVADFQEAGKEGNISYNGMSMMSDLRKLANHPLLLRYYYTDSILPKIAQRLAADPRYKDTVEQYIFDDLACMSDFHINSLTKEYPSIRKFALPEDLILVSGKFEYLDKKLKDLKTNGHRVLLFSQYVIMLDIMEEYMRIRKHSYLRLDGSTPVTIRQQLIDEFTEDPTIFIFLLSTKAGGLGINLTAADTVIIHDIDFNPYNDKQAEDRCHRMGQTKPVQVFRLVSGDTIEEGMWQLAQEKLKLEKEISSDDYENTDLKSVVSLLSKALNMDSNRVSTLVSPLKPNQLSSIL